MNDNSKPKIAIGCLAISAGTAVIFTLLSVVYFFGTWSLLVSGNEGVKQAIGNIQADLQRRSDLIPNLVNTVKGYASHEKEVLTEVTEARSRVGKIDLGNVAENPEAMNTFVKNQNQLSGALSRLLLVVEKYPDLKANENFRDLQAQLEGTENRIGVSRKRYNDAVKPYNIMVHGPISHFVANAAGYNEYQYYQADESSQKTPIVQFKE